MKFFRSLVALCLTAIMLCTMGVSAFAYNDVPLDDESLKAIEFVDRLGIITSTWNGDFKPDQYLTRADAVVAVYKMLYREEIDQSLYSSAELEFVGDGTTGDISDSSALKAYLAWAVDNYLITANVENALFKPSQAITADELLTLLAKVLCLVEDGATYPDDYVDAMSGIETGLEAGETPVTRAQAAVAFAAAIVSSEGSSGELGVYVDDDGNPIDSLASKVFNMASVDLIIRATTSRKLGYEVENGVLLSNGADIAVADDLTDYIGYGITITFCDEDGSGLFTEDEEVLTYSISSTLSATVPLTDVSITSGGTAEASTDIGNFKFATSTFLYLNDAPWPVNDSKYDLASLVGSLKGKTTRIINRPNLTFKCMLPEGQEIASAVFATESRPGKIMGINNGIYTIYDYYYSGTSNEMRNYNVTDCRFSGTVKVGDFVSFFEADGICHINPGNAVVTQLKKKEVTDLSIKEGESTNEDLVTTIIGKSGAYTFSDDSIHLEHAFFKLGDCKLVAAEDLKGPKYTFLTDGSEDSYVITWEAYQANYATLMIDKITEVKEEIKDANGTVTGYGKLLSYDIEATNVKTKKSEIKFNVLVDNINSTTPLAVGDIITYSDDDIKEPVVDTQAPENSGEGATGEGATGDGAAPASETANAPAQENKVVTVYVRKTASKTVTVTYNKTDRKFVEMNAKGEIVNTYYENQSYMGKKDDPSATLADGETITATLALDMANTVVYYK